MRIKKISFILMVGLSTATSISLFQDKAVYANQTINWTESADLTTMNPSQANDSTGTEIITQTGQGLYRYGKHNQPQLADAKSVDVSKGGHEYVFHLKDNLRWSNHEKVTASDYVFGIQQTVDPKNKSNGATLANNIKNATAVTNGKKPASDLGVEALDSQTLKITLNNPDPAFKSILTGTAFYPQPKKFVMKVGKAYGTSADKSLSNGPFVLKNWNGSDKSYQLVKNNDYEDKGKVTTNKINIQTVTDNTTGYNLYKVGKSDYTSLTADQVRANENNQAYHTIKNGRTDFLGLNLKNKYLQNKKVRVAIKQAINTKGLTNKVLNGIERSGNAFTPENTIKNPDNQRDFSKDANSKKYTFNKRDAKNSLAESNVKKIKLTLLADNDDQSKVEAQYVQSQLQNNLPGVELTVKFQPKAARVKAQLSHDFDIVLTSWGGEYADPMSFLNMIQSDSGINISQFNDKKYDSALARANGNDVNQPDKRYQDLLQAEQRIHSELPVVTLGHQSIPALIRPNIKGLLVNTYGATFDFKEAYKK